MNYNSKPRHEYAIQAKRRWTLRVNVSITGTNTEWDNPRQIRENDVGKLLIQEKWYYWDYGNWTYERRYAHPGNALMLSDGWQLIYLTMAIYTKLCGILPYLIYLLSMTMTIYETSNWMPRCRYTYRTEYNPEYYSSDYIKQPYGRDYNALYTAKFVTKLYYQDDYPKGDPDSNSAIMSNTTTMAIEDCKLTPESSPFQSVVRTKPYESSRRWSNNFENRGITVLGSQTTPTANNYGPGSAGTKHQNDDKCAESSDGKHTYRWID